MESGITWYEILGVLPGAEAEKIRRTYDARMSLLRGPMISGAPSNGLVVDQSPRAPGKLRRHETLTAQVWHPPIRFQGPVR